MKNKIFVKRKLIGLCCVGIAVALLAGCASKSNFQEEQVAPEKKINKIAAADINIKLGMAYLTRRKDPVEAKRKFLKALALAPKQAAPWYGMGYFLESTGDVAGAKKYFDKSVALAPKNGEVQNNYGTFLCRNGQPKASIPHFLLAVKDPIYLEVGEAYENAGVCALAIPNVKRAEKLFKKAFIANPGLPRSMFELATIYYNQGKYKLAQRMMTDLAVVDKAPYAQVLWLNIRINKKLGNKAIVANDSKVLLSTFPKSVEAAYLSGKKPTPKMAKGLNVKPKVTVGPEKIVASKEPALLNDKYFAKKKS